MKTVYINPIKTSTRIASQKPVGIKVGGSTLFGKIVGEARIRKVTNDSKVITEKVFIANDFCDYRILNKNGECLGFTTLHSYSPGTNNQYGVDCRYTAFPGAIHVEKMESLDDSYIGVGTLLHELAVLASKKAGFEGRVLLDAEKSSHIFHYKFGFRSMGHRYWLYDEKIEREIEKAERKIRKGLISSTKEHDTSHLGPIPMYLPEEEIQEIISGLSHSRLLL